MLTPSDELGAMSVQDGYEGMATEELQKLVDDLSLVGEKMDKDYFSLY